MTYFNIQGFHISSFDKILQKIALQNLKMNHHIWSKYGEWKRGGGEVSGETGSKTGVRPELKHCGLLH